MDIKEYQCRHVSNWRSTLLLFICAAIDVGLYFTYSSVPLGKPLVESSIWIDVFVVAIAVLFFCIAVGGVYQSAKRNQLRFSRCIVLVIWMLAFSSFILTNATAMICVYVTIAIGVVLLPRKEAIFLTIAIYASSAIYSYILTSISYPDAGFGPFLSLGALVAFVFFFSSLFVKEYDARHKNEKLNKALTAANEKLNAYALEIETLTKEKERLRIAQELHDTVGHYLAASSIHLEVVKSRDLKTQPQWGESIENVSTSIKSAYGALRDAVHALHDKQPNAIHLALGKMVETWRTPQLKVSLEVKGEPVSLGPKLDLTLFRVSQEALVNVQKHSNATDCSFCIDYQNPKVVELTVTDNGVGTDHLKHGTGIMGMIKRIAECDGQVDFFTNKGKGFKLNLRLPIMN